MKLTLEGGGCNMIQSCFGDVVPFGHARSALKAGDANCRKFQSISADEGTLLVAAFVTSSDLKIWREFLSKARNTDIS